jgi:DNA-binding NtrC family response regulator
LEDTDLAEGRSPISGARVLLLEDDALISMDAEDMLRDLGAGRVYVAHTLEAARTILDVEPVDAAVLDVLIGSGRSDDLARLLADRAIPFVFASGYGDSPPLPGVSPRVPKLQKPYSADGLKLAFESTGLARPRLRPAAPAAG